MLLSLKKRLIMIRKEKRKKRKKKSLSPLSPSPAFLLLPYFNLHGMGLNKAGKSDPHTINKLRNDSLYLSTLKLIEYN